MNALVATGTGAVLGDYEQLTSVDMERAQAHTRLGQIVDPALGRALRQFELALPEPLAVLRSFTHRPGSVVVNTIDAVFDLVSGTPWVESEIDDTHGTTGTDDAVTTVENISERLELPTKDTLKAAGISRSTFYSWKTSTSPQPRLASQGRLWELSQAVDDLDELLDEVEPASWLRADRRRLGMLRKGSFDALLREATRARRPADDKTFESEYIGAYAVGGDHDPSARDVDSTRRPTSRRVNSAPLRGRADRRTR